MANPSPEVRPEEAATHVRVMATGRTDYPGQIDNVLAIPSVFDRDVSRAVAGAVQEMAERTRTAAAPEQPTTERAALT